MSIGHGISETALAVKKVSFEEILRRLPEISQRRGSLRFLELRRVSPRDMARPNENGLLAALRDRR
jgi:hypothetical protein